MSGKSCSGYFQISTHLGSICTFWTESETWPVAESAFPWAHRHLSKCLSRQESWKGLELLHPVLQPHFHAIILCTPSSRRISPILKLPTPVQGCTHLSVMCFCKKYLNPVHSVYWTVRYLDSIQVCYVWNVLTLHKFVRTDDDIKHKLAQGNHAASLPSPTHTRTQGTLSAQVTLKCNSSPEKWDMLSFYSHICRVLLFFLFFSSPLFPWRGVLPWWSLFFIAKNYIPDKRKSGSSLKDILGSLECCQKAWGGTI